MQDDNFKTPEEIANQESDQTATPLINEDQGEKVAMGNPKKRKFKLTKKQIIILIVILIIIIGGVITFLIINHKSTRPIAPKVTIKKQLKPVSDLVPSNLTGLPVNPSVNQLPVTAVMIENSLAARPQSGLGQAGVVFEALTEGGITRFMALYQDTAPTYVGPVRSARPYFVQWLLGFDAAYAHVGGSPLALLDIQNWGVRDLNQFYNGSYYTRISSRYAPHNVYTSIANLHNLEAKKGFLHSNFTSWPRTPATPLKTPTVTKINLTLSGPDYNPSYSYNPSTNSYDRSEAGEPQIGTDLKKQISPKVVIAMIIPETNGSLDSTGAYYADYATIGSGQVYVFQNGGVQIGQWTKNSNNSQIMFTTSSGQPLKLIPGQVWITAVSSSSYVSY